MGAALANKKHGRISVNIQCDGDLNYAPGVLWTAAHHRIPMLNIMHNNRAYHQELMYVEDMAARAKRGVERVKIGTAIEDPNINYAMMAKAYGMYQRRSHRESERSGTGHQARYRSGEEGRAGHDRRGHATEVTHEATTISGYAGNHRGIDGCKLPPATPSTARSCSSETAVMNAMATLHRAAATVLASQSSGSTRKG